MSNRRKWIATLKEPIKKKRITTLKEYEIIKSYKTNILTGNADWKLVYRGNNLPLLNIWRHAKHSHFSKTIMNFKLSLPENYRKQIKYFIFLLYPYFYQFDIWNTLVFNITLPRITSLMLLLLYSHSAYNIITLIATA